MRQGLRVSLLILGALLVSALVANEMRHPGAGFALLISPLYLIGTPVDQVVAGLAAASVVITVIVRGRKSKEATR